MFDHLNKLISNKKIFIKKDYFEIVVDKNEIIPILKILKEDGSLKFNQLIDITAIDYPSKKSRFTLIYIIQSLIKNKRVLLKVLLEEKDQVDTITSIFKAANWYERECYDLFGVMFKNHPDLRRIMTDYNFEGHPLRKDFPLTGHTEVRYDDLEKKVIYEPVKLTQEFRNFDYESPWSGIADSLTQKNESNTKEDDERS